MAKLLDFRKDSDRYVFRWEAEGDAFNQTLLDLKASIPLLQRSFNSETKEWSVKVTQANERALAFLFENGKSCVAAVKAQLSLW